MLVKSVIRAEKGLIDADLGGGVIKQRIGRQGGGRSGGYRTLILFRSGDRAVFAYGFAKKDRDNISETRLALLRDAAGIALAYDPAELARIVGTGKLVEIRRDEEG